MAKVVVSEALHKAVDTSLQLNGARGYSKEQGDAFFSWETAADAATVQGH